MPKTSVTIDFGWFIPIHFVSSPAALALQGYLEVNETVRPKIIEAYQYKRGADVGRSSIRCWALVLYCSCLDLFSSLHVILGCLDVVVMMKPNDHN